MKIKRLFPAVIAVVFVGTILCVEGQAQQSRPDLSGKWTLIEGESGASSPLGSEGSIAQDGSAVTFKSLKVPFDGSTTTTQDSAFVWQHEGRWVGTAFVVSMKASSGGTPGNFTDLMVVTPTSAGVMTMVLMRTTLTGNMSVYTLKYRKV
jgi:hypothetical protein